MSYFFLIIIYLSFYKFSIAVDLFPINTVSSVHIQTDSNSYFQMDLTDGLILSKTIKLDWSQKFYIEPVPAESGLYYIYFEDPTQNQNRLGDGVDPFKFNIRSFIKDDPNQFFRLEIGGFDKTPFFDSELLESLEIFYRVRLLPFYFMEKMGINIMLYTLNLDYVWAIKDASLADEANIVILDIASVTANNNHIFQLQPSSESAELYYIYSVFSGKYLQLLNDNYSDGVLLVQSTKRCNRENQLFKLNRDETDFIKVQHYKSNRIVQVWGGYYFNNAELRTYGTEGGHNSKFKITKLV